MKFDWNVVLFSLEPMFRGLVMTVEISVVVMLCAVAVGILLGLASLSHFAPLRYLISGYVFFVRGVPPLVLILLVYFAPPALGIDLNPFVAAVIALTINAGAYNTEIIRAGLLGIDQGQTEAAKAIGMTWRSTLILVLLPQALRKVLPPLTNELITIIKTTPILSVISIYELTGSGKAIVAEKFAPLEIYFMLAVAYIALTALLSLFTRYLEWKFAR